MTKSDMCVKVAEIILDIPQCDGARDYVDIDEAARQIVDLISPVPKLHINDKDAISDAMRSMTPGDQIIILGSESPITIGMPSLDPTLDD